MLGKKKGHLVVGKISKQVEPITPNPINLYLEVLNKSNQLALHTKLRKCH